AIGYEEAKAFLDVLKEKKEGIKMSIEEKDKYIDKMIGEIKGPIPSETVELIAVMKEKIDELEGFLNKIQDENASLKKALSEKEVELLKTIKERDELIKKEQDLTSAIDELKALIDGKEKELKAKDIEIERLRIENKRLAREKNQIRTFSYFLIGGAIIGLILDKTAE
ncbi:MAG: hypothetical protein AB1630_12560, partial [bacterium]